MLLSSVSVLAQTKTEENTAPQVARMMRPYKWSDNLFWGFNIGGGYSMSEYVQQIGTFTSIRPQGSLVFGKYYNPWLGARLDIGYHWQQCALDPNFIDDPVYDVHMASAYLDGMICLNRLVMPRYNPRERVQLVGIVGGGGLWTIAFSDNVSDWTGRAPISDSQRLSWVFRAGGQIHLRMNESLNFNLNVLWNMVDPKYNGLTNTTSPRHFMEFGFGITTRLFNRYGSRRFEYCRGNEIYYFKYFEDQLLHDHQKQLKRSRKGKCPEPIMAAEQDTVLIFPVGYPYLTPRQEAKVDKVIAYLLENPHNIVSIDLYPIVLDDPKMTPAQSVDRCADVIKRKILKGNDDIKSYQLVFNRYSCTNFRFRRKS